MRSGSSNLDKRFFNAWWPLTPANRKWLTATFIRRRPKLMRIGPKIGHPRAFSERAEPHDESYYFCLRFFFFLRHILWPTKVNVNPDVFRKLHFLPLPLPRKTRNFAHKSHKPGPFFSAKDIGNPLSSAPYRPEKPEIFYLASLTWSDFHEILHTC